MQRAALASTKEDKERLLPWNTKDIVKKDYRITFSRREQQGKPGHSDSYIYFENKQEVIIFLILS